MTVISFRKLQRLTVKELIELLPVTVTVEGEEVMTVNKIGEVTVREEIMTVNPYEEFKRQVDVNIKDTIKTKEEVGTPKKIKLNKNGYCPHFILGGNNCRNCNG